MRARRRLPSASAEVDVRRWIWAITLASGVFGVGTIAGCGPGYPHCEKAADCHQGEYCVMQRCQQCRNADDCSASQRCVHGRCE